jgi:transcriptional regulator with XRE-family HTH domain
MAAGALTVPRLFLGQALKRLRSESGKTLDEVAATIGKSRARVINVLDGKATLTAAELGRLLDFLGAGAQQKTELMELGSEARKRPPRRQYADLVPASYRRIVDLESMATEFCSYERGIIPGLLQTPEYIEAIMAIGDGIWWESSWQARHDRVNFRLARQELIMNADPPKTMHFVIADDGLRTEVGGPEVMARQLRHLLSLIDERSNVTIQVLPTTTANNPAPGAGLILLRLAQHHAVGLLPVLYGPSVYIDDPVDTDRLSRAFGRVAELALPPEESRDFIDDLAKRV